MPFSVAARTPDTQEATWKARLVTTVFHARNSKSHARSIDPSSTSTEGTRFLMSSLALRSIQDRPTPAQTIGSGFLLPLLFIHGGERYYRMCVGAAGPHLGGDPDRLHDFLRGCSVLHRRFGVTLDAIGTLSDVGGCYRDELLCLGWQCAVGEHELAEGVERGLDVGRELLTLPGEVLGCWWIH